MNNKNIIIAGAIAIGVYLLSQGKEILSIPAAYTTRQKAAQKRIGQPITRAAYIAAAQKKVAERVPERRPVLPAIPMSKKIPQKKVVRTGMALKIYGLKKAIAAAQALRLSTMAPGAVLPPLLSKAIQNRIVKAATHKKGVAQKTAVQQKKAQKTAVHNAIARWVAARKAAVARKAVVPNMVARWVAARKTAVQQKKVQKKTPITPSARRKKRLRALYGSHWHDIWVQRQRR